MMYSDAIPRAEDYARRRKLSIGFPRRSIIFWALGPRLAALPPRAQNEVIPAGQKIGIRPLKKHPPAYPPAAERLAWV
jgi:hypothetical protein